MPGSSASPRRSQRRAVIIGGSMSGLFSAAFLRQIGWDVDVYERSRRRTGRPRRRHHRPSGTARRAGSERRRHRGSRRRSAQAHRDRPRWPHHRRAAAAADPHLLGPAATPAARHHRPGALPSRPQFRARRAGRARRARAFHRRPSRAGRHPGRRRRHPLERARADGARGAADLCRLLHLARRAERGRPRAEDAAQHLSAVHLLSAAAPGGDHLSDRRLRRRPARPASGASISSGTASPTPRSCARCASTRTACSTNIRCRRR